MLGSLAPALDIGTAQRALEERDAPKTVALDQGLSKVIAFLDATLRRSANI
jgi:hypothetical protein